MLGCTQSGFRVCWDDRQADRTSLHVHSLEPKAGHSVHGTLLVPVNPQVTLTYSPEKFTLQPGLQAPGPVV